MWHKFDIVVPWFVSFEWLILWVMASNRSVPNSQFFHSPYVSAIRNFFGIKLVNVIIGGLIGEGVVRRDSSSFRFL